MSDQSSVRFYIDNKRRGYFGAYHATVPGEANHSCPIENE